MSVKVHYSYEDIEDYLDYEDPEAVMQAARKADGLPPAIRLAEPWELGPPVLRTTPFDWEVVPAYDPTTGSVVLTPAPGTPAWLAAQAYPGGVGDALDGDAPHSSSASAPAAPARGQSHGR